MDTPTTDNLNIRWRQQREQQQREQQTTEALDSMQRDHDARLRAQQAQDAHVLFDNVVKKGIAELGKRWRNIADLANPDVYVQHANMVVWVANNIVLRNQNRPFVIDDNNSAVIRFLLYYFNDCPLAEEVFPGRGYKLHKHIMLMGKAGVGKTLLMQIFSEYLRLTDNPNHFHNLSVTQMVNYYTLHNNLDRYTYNEEGNRAFEGLPYNVCLNDVGVQSTKFFGIETLTLVSEFLHARNEIWSKVNRAMAHITTNLTVEQLRETFNDGYHRLNDRFKTYNVIPLGGESRR